jgi:FtsP/CotA-like multicopper oxidase with cupredoxin domain
MSRKRKISISARGTNQQLLAVAIGVSALFRALPALADKPGCEYKTIDVAKYGEQPLKNPPEIRSSKGVLKTDIVVQYTDPERLIVAGCPIHLRTYGGQLVGPTLRLKPGDVLDANLVNRLPVETPDQIQAQFEQESQNAHLGMFPAAFNTTNLHTHGLHVSPTGNSDNVLLNVPPGTSFPYEIKVPANHPPGSFWYHAHAHGSTSIQVGSGMAGALILDDDPAKIPPTLRAANAAEKILVLETILYNRNGELNQITALFPSPTNPSDCSKPGNPDTWLCSMRQVMINGQITPVITMRPGEVQRWRLIDAAFRESFNITLEGHPLHEIALDGLYLGHVDTWPTGKPIELQPGYRSDVLVQASETPGTYRLINGQLPAARAVDAVARSNEEVIALVKVEGEPVSMALPTNQEMAQLAPFPGVDLRKSANGVQEVAFKLGSDLQQGRNYFQVNYQSFDSMLPRTVVLNSTDQWSLTTVGDPAADNGIPPLPHVFHIHVNPFQMVRTDPAGADELVWKDTVLVPTGTGPNNQTISQTVNVYTRYTDYIGQFVLHCHILDHEDLGMMQVVEVVEPEAIPLRLRMEMHAHN